MRPIRCWWFGCERHQQDPSPPDNTHCMHCGKWIEYSDLVGDTRHNRFKEFCARFSLRRLFPKRCPDCGRRYKHDESIDHIPF